MIDITNETLARLDSLRVANVYQRANALKLQLAQAKQNVESKHLVEWRAEAQTFVAIVEAELRAAEKRIVDFEARVPELEKTVSQHIQASRDVEAISQLIALQGTDDRAEALRRRDDLCFAEARVLHWRRVADQLTYGARSLLPSAGNAPAPAGREIVEAIGRSVTAKKFGRGGGVSHEQRVRWIDQCDEDTLACFTWHALAVIAAAKQERRETDRHDPRREDVTLPVDDFLAELSSFRAQRAAAIKAKVSQVHAELEAAKARAAALGSAVAS